MWARLGRRLTSVSLVALLLFAVPLPEEWPAFIRAFQVPGAVIITICLTGKMLYDTFFYDRYLPYSGKGVEVTNTLDTKRPT